MIICAIGGLEIGLICLVILLIFGGKKLPELMRGAGKGVKSFKEGMAEPSDEEVKRRVDEEVRRRADEEVQRRVDDEVRRRADEEMRRRADEETRHKEAETATPDDELK